MIFTLPIWNLTAWVWRTPATPPASPTFEYDAQLYFFSRGIPDVKPLDLDLYQPPVYLRVPIDSDLQRGDIVECEPSSGWFYKVRFVERTHLGFDNQYLTAVLEQTSNGSIPPPAPGSYIDQENGDEILQEDSGGLLQE